MKTSKLLLSLTLVILVSMAALIWFFPVNGDFRVDNPFWNGLSSLESDTDLSPLNSFDSLPVEPEHTALLLVPYEPFSQVELEQLKAYVSNGGTLVVLDDYGYGNEVLKAVGLNVTFTGETLLDPLFNYRNKFLPKITDFTNNSAITANVSSIMFNHASCLNNTDDVTVLAFSSRFSFLDTNDNGAWDSYEPTGPLPVAAYCKLSQGDVVVVTDPSFLINGMLELDDNLRFIDNIVGLHDADQVFVDQLHLPRTALDDAKSGLGVVYGVVASPLGTLTLIAVVLVISLKPMWRSGGKVGKN